IPARWAPCSRRWRWSRRVCRRRRGSRPRLERRRVGEQRDGMLRLAALDGGGARHAFFTRRGGVSEGLFASLNCGFGSGDDPDRVARNRAAAADRLGLPAARLITCNQVHSAAVVTVTEPWPAGAAPRADGMVTAAPGIALAVPAAGVIGAAHGGWRGTLAGVMEATVAGMVALGARAERIRAGIGPCIAR